jgi:hypothetical protein
MVIISGEIRRHAIVICLQRRSKILEDKNLNFDREMERIVTRWVMTQDTDWCQKEIEQLFS